MKSEKINYEIIEQDFFREGKRIVGELYLPNLPFCPLVIISHGLGGNGTHSKPYAEYLAESGIASYVFDFIGGGEDIRSDGKMTEMSVLTEEKDLNIVLDGLKENPQIDKENIFLLGRSQGGYVSTLVASERSKEIKGMVLLYPAYVIQDDVMERTESGKHFEPSSTFLSHTVSDIYDRDALSVDIYARMRKYSGEVLIIHGTDDQTVPIAYSCEAIETFPHAKIEIIDGGGHGFIGKDNDKAMKISLDFIKENLD
nr:alpha/beta fold hydrolase [Clostridia bacterium]